MSDLKTLLTRHEGLVLKPYLDCCGKAWRECACDKKGFMTIGVGTNLDAGLTTEEAFFLRDRRILRSAAGAAMFPWFKGLDPVRKDVVVMMVFNMGLEKFCGFKKTIAAIEMHDYERAASEMLSSAWSAQVGKRACELAEMMRVGRYP